MRISDWSSDVCSSDLPRRLHDGMRCLVQSVGDIDQHSGIVARRDHCFARSGQTLAAWFACGDIAQFVISIMQDRKSVMLGKSVSVLVSSGGRRLIKKKKSYNKSILQNIYSTTI